MSGPRWKKIADSIGDRIRSGELKPGEKLASEDVLCVEYGVSRPTAHRAIRELQTQGLVKRQRRWGTVVTEHEPRKSGRVALIIDFVDENYGFPQSGLIRGLQAGLGQEVSMILCDSHNDPAKEAALIEKMSGTSDGIILYPTSDSVNTPLLQGLVDRGVPLVVLDRLPQDLRANVVLSDNYEISLKAVRNLIERGHERIAFFSFYKPHVSTVHDRYSAYCDAHAEAGLALEESNVRFFSVELEHVRDRRFFQAVQDSLFRLTHGEKRVTALFCVQDMFAAASLDALDEAGLHVPEDIEIATFNDWPVMMLRRPWQLHRIVQRSFDIGKAAGEVLADTISNSEAGPQVRKIPAEFILADAGLLPESSESTPFIR